MHCYNHFVYFLQILLVQKQEIFKDKKYLNRKRWTGKRFWKINVETFCVSTWIKSNTCMHRGSVAIISIA